MAGQIKNIVFDLGGVLLNLDYQRTSKAFEKLGVKHFDTMYSQAKQSNLFDLYETGKIKEEDFINELKQYLPHSVSAEQIIFAWNAMLLDFAEDRLKLLLGVKNKYRTFLLSNTNETHIQAFEKTVEAEYGLKGLESLFEKTYYSSRMGRRKPDADTFRYVLQENNLVENETVFFDDSIQHIEGAADVGIKAIFVQQPKTITDFFDNSYNLIQS